MQSSAAAAAAAAATALQRETATALDELFARVSDLRAAQTLLGDFSSDVAQEVKRLRKRCVELEDRVEHKRVQRRNVRTALMMQQEARAGATTRTSASSAAAAAAATAATSVAHRRINAHVMHRLTGVSLYARDAGVRDEVVARIETSFRGRFLDCHYVVLRRRAAIDGRATGAGTGGAAGASGQSGWFVHSHTLPAAVPVSELAARHLASDVRAFVGAVQDVANAVCFRTQCVRALLGADTGVALRASRAFDLVELVWRGRMRMRCAFDSLASVEPEHVQIELASSQLPAGVDARRAAAERDVAEDFSRLADVAVALAAQLPSVPAA